jgi:FMN-dependent oxidoreductase (nitrilotriacetate monooxygenase family)
MQRERIYLNAFHMNCVVHQSPGLWVHPADQMHRYTDLTAWVELATLLERGKLDGLFLADVLGVYDVYRNNREAAVTQATQIPVNDPMVPVSAMAYATQHLGFAFTSSVLQSHPFPFARQMSTLDHLTNGRIGWNVVTSYLESGARNLGQSGLPPHDERYEIADEYLDVCYKLWEASWDDDAVVKDRQRGIYADPAKVHAVQHEGRYFPVHGCHLSEPSPQRTPVSYQAGASPRGRAFAARHAECVFLTGPTPQVVGQLITETRASAQQYGRDPQDLLFFMYLKVITGDTETAAQRKYKEFLELVNYDGALALLSGWSGIDFSQLDPDQPLAYVETNAVRTLFQSFAQADPEPRWTMRDLAKFVGIGGGGPVLVGGPEQIVDKLQEWIAVGVDGFNLAYAITPGTFEDFIDGVVPVLQQRELMQRDYQEGTFREKLFGPGRARLQPPHPAAQYRRS